MVGRTPQPPVLLHGGSVVLEPFDVVDIAVFGRLVTSQLGAEAVAQFDGSAFGAAEHPGPLRDADAIVGAPHGSLEIRTLDQIDHLVDGEVAPVLELAHPPVKRLEVDEDRDERAAGGSAGSGGLGPSRHHDKGIVAALGRCSREVVDRGALAVSLLGAGPVDREQLIGDAAQRGLEQRAGHRRHAALEVANAVERLRHVQSPVAVGPFRPLGDVVAVVHLGPVLDGSRELERVEQLGLFEEEVLSLDQVPEALGVRARHAQPASLPARHDAAHHRSHDQGQVRQAAGIAVVGPSLLPAHSTVGRQPLRRRRPVAGEPGERPALLEGVVAPGDGDVEAVSLLAQPQAPGGLGLGVELEVVDLELGGDGFVQRERVGLIAVDVVEPLMGLVVGGEHGGGPPEVSVSLHHADAH